MNKAFLRGLVSIALFGVVLFSGPGLRAQAVIHITELSAWRDSGLLDEDGEANDWFELFNGGDQAISLEGFKVTDDAENLAKWEFPAVTLEPGAFLVVFASGKDRRNPEGELHTNFRLNKDGELIALLTPDGQNVISGFASFPAQLPDASFGLSMNTVRQDVLVDGDPVRVLVPTDGSLGLDWIQPDFDDSSWRLGTTGVGLERASTYRSHIGTDVEDEMYEINATCYLRQTFEVGDPAEIDIGKLLVKYDDGFIAYLNGVRIAEDNAPEGDPVWNSEADGSHSDSRAVRFTEFPINHAIELLVPGQNVLAVHALNSSAGNSDFLITPTIQFLSIGDVDPSTELFFQTPTPGEPNGLGVSGVAPIPEFSHDSGAYLEPPVVSIDALIDGAPLEGAVIRYTTNGAVPDEESTVYTAPIEVGGSAQLVARVFHPELLPSPPNNRVFTTVAASATNIESNLPICVVSTPGRVISGSCDGLYTNGFFMVFEPDEATGRVTLRDPATFAHRAGFRRRGSSTCGRPKFSLNVEIRNDEGEDEDVNLFGMGEGSDWALYGPYNFDYALMRNPLAYWMSRQAGRYAVRTRFVEVFVQSGNSAITSASYFGVYVFMEKIRRAPHRVDIARLRAGDNREPEVTGGYIMKIDRVGGSEVRVTGVGGQSVVMVYPNRPTSQQQQYLRTFGNQMSNSLNRQTVLDNPLVDAGGWMDHHILNTFPKNVDAFRLSGYMHKDRNGPLVMGPVWDYDRSMGSTDGRDSNPTSWPNTGGDGGTAYFAFGWYNRLFGGQPPLGNDPWATAYRSRWRELRQGAISEEAIDNKLLEWKALLAEAGAAERNFQKWRFPGGAPRGGRGWEGEVDHLRTWLRRRGQWIDAQFVESPRITPQGGQVEEGQQVEILIEDPSATIWYTTDGSAPKGTGSSPGETAIRYQGPITITSNTLLRARAHFGGSLWSSEVSEGFITRLSKIVLTEINYHPADATPEEDPTDDFSATDLEFLEIKNVDNVAVDLTGYRFAGVTFTFESDTNNVLAPGEVMVLHNDEAAFLGRYGDRVANVRVGGEFSGSLSDSSETLRLQGLLDEDIFAVRYDDDWYPETDGNGKSLQLIDPYSDPETHSDPAAWKPSETLHGTPGIDDSAPVGGLRRIGDVDANGRLNVSDAVGVLRQLFSEGGVELPCGDGTLDSPGNVTLLDVNLSGSVNLTDAVHLLNFLFQNGDALGISPDCVAVPGCEDGC